MPAATPRIYFRPLCQHELLLVISTLKAGSLCRVMLTMATRSMFFILSEKKHKIVEILALLQLSNYKMCKVGMLFCILYNLQFNVNYNTEHFVNRF